MLLALLYALVVVVAILSWWVFGDAWWNQLINLTAFWLLVPSVGLLALALVFARWMPALILLVPVVVLVGAYGGQFVGPSTSSVAADERDLRVASYNLWFRSPGAEHAIELVRDASVDVLLVQEATQRHADDLTRQLTDELGHTWFGDPDRFGGVGVVSRFPIEDVRVVADPANFEHPTAVVELAVPRGGDLERVQVVPLHLIPACPVCGPFAERSREEVASRRYDTNAVLEALDPELPAVVGGDLNGDRWSAPYRTLVAAGFRDPHREVGFGLGFTYPGDHPTPDRSAAAPVAHIPFVSFPVLRLDHVLARDLAPVAARVGDARASDHRPVIVDLAW